MGAPRKHANAFARAQVGSQRARERFEREREESLALVRRPVPPAVHPDAKALAAIALYRVEKARAIERGAKLSESSGRHPRTSTGDHQARHWLRAAL